jgi:hypothetical protein
LLRLLVKNQVQLSGKLNVTETINDGLEMSIQGDRCQLDGQNCDAFREQRFNGVCDRLAETNSFLTPFFEHIEPRLKCPLQKVRKFFLITVELFGWTKNFVPILYIFG